MRNKKYNVIYADPPWPYDDKRTSKACGMVLGSYQTMTLDAIKFLPINKLADKDCLLFLWATFPKLPEAIEVLRAWGFKYITVAFVWVKLNPKNGGIYSGMGHWTNANAEIVLLGRRGRIPRMAKNVKQITMAARGGHSVKPLVIAEKIVQLVGNLPRIELFARKSLPGWDIIEGKDTGNENGKDIVDYVAANYE